MTQGIVSILVNGEMKFKVITGHDGYNAKNLAAWLRKLDQCPSLGELGNQANACDFGAEHTRVILEAGERWNEPIIHCTDGMDECDNEGRQRYLDTFHVAQFNPRWKYGTADYVEVVEFKA